ncbi:MAG TPA: mannose-1-phosphate guanylyltransferase/mannose-6-phosphate isomerase [Candidatus Acetothermia bacterium]|nr:mannose-1-phosphate guanylyltransferase/mannose-6-phosphate isomerase [Candidatus Acetothermia bacterium]
MQGTAIQPVILSGGSGTRLWPLSRTAYPKQFLDIFGGHSLFQQTCVRVNDPLFAAPSILSNNDHRFIVVEQLKQIGIEPNKIILEPVGRNTAPAVLIASLLVAEDDENSLLLLLPSDHIIADAEEFRDCIRKGIEPAQEGKIITFGVQPQSPHTGYGYIETGDARGAAFDVRRFVEKPTKEKAEEYLAGESYFWNAGIFLFSACSMIEAFKEHMPDMLEICQEALSKARNDLDFLRLDEAAFSRCEDISIDYAIMERSQNIYCVPLTTSWSDLGSWAAIAEQAVCKEDDNASRGDVMFHNSRNCYGHSTDGASLSVVGLDNVIAVVTKDAVLVTSKEHAEDVKQIVQQHKAINRNSVTYHRRVYRPWGWFEGLERGDRFQVKCLMVTPGEKLSLQSHHHRAEHWVVVSGTARVTVGEKVFLLTENESTYIPIGATHRLENPGQIPALLIEVQSGSYLNEDDIVRYEDIYNREEED